MSFLHFFGLQVNCVIMMKFLDLWTANKHKKLMQKIIEKKLQIKVEKPYLRDLISRFASYSRSNWLKIIDCAKDPIYILLTN
jgi:hypothetical protein